MPRDSSRPCGCDPAEDYICAGHADYRDPTRSLITAPGSRGAIRSSARLSAVVSGPDSDGDVVVELMDGSRHYFARFFAEDLATEILRRLQPRAE